MRILSWDVGIYNLCYCILEKNDETNELKIIDWSIVNLVDDEKMKKNKSMLFENIPKKLYHIPDLLDVDYVVIENQPSLKNPQMKSIQMILYSYFIIMGKTIEMGNDKLITSIDFCSASNKLKVYNGPKLEIKKKETKTKSKKKDEENLINNDTINNLINEESKVNEEDKVETNKKATIKYADKKKLAILHAQYYIEKYFPSYNEFFNSHKKKDDLSDALLQSLYYLKQLDARVI